MYYRFATDTYNRISRGRSALPQGKLRAQNEREGLASPQTYTHANISLCMSRAHLLPINK